MRKPLEVVGWKPKPKWYVSLRRHAFGATGSAFSSSEADRMTRSCESLEDGRKIAETYFKKGWESAWIYEKDK